MNQIPTSTRVSTDHENPPSDRRIRTLVIARPGRPPEAELRRLIAEGAMPDIVSADDAIGATILDDRYFASVGGLRGRVLRRLPYLAAQAAEVLARGKDYDAVLTWSDQPAIVVAAVMRFWRRRPGHVALLYWPSKPKKAIPLRLVQRGIDRILMFSPLQQRFVEENLQIPADRFVRVGFKVDTGFWHPMSGAQDMICSVGQEMRDYGTLLEALGPLGIPCHIAAGSGIFTGTNDKWWRATVGQLTPPSQVTVGKKSFVELRELYARSRFVVVPLLPTDNDNGVTAILEAFAMGKTVICTKTAGQTDVLEPGVNCLQVPPCDATALRNAILELWNDPDKCERLGAAGRAAAVAGHGVDQWTAGLTRAVEGAVLDRAAFRHAATA